jgi:polysaccharide transporter, PST family
MTLRRAVAVGIGWTALERFSGQALAFVVFWILARFLDKRDFGLVALAGLHIAFVRVFVTDGLGTAIVQRRVLTRAHLDAAFWLSLAMALVLGGFTVEYRETLAGVLGETAAADVLGVLTLALPLAAMTIVPSALLTRELRFKSLALRTTIAAAAGGAVGVGVALGNAGVWALVAQQLVVSAVFFTSLLSAVSWRPGAKATSSAFIDLGSFALGVMANNLLWFLGQRIDQAVIGRQLGVEVLGAYALSLRIVNVALQSITEPPAAVALPMFSRLQDERRALGQAFVRSTSMICALGFPVFVWLLLVAPTLIPVVFGRKWTTAVVPLQILCVSGILRVAQTFVHPIFMALGRPGVYTASFGVFAVSNTIGVFFAAGWGIEAIASAVTVAFLVTGLANLVALRFHIELSGQTILQSATPIVGSCIVMTLAVVGLRFSLVGHLPDTVLVAAETVVAFASYTAILARVAPGLLADLLRSVQSLYQRDEAAVS